MAFQSIGRSFLPVLLDGDTVLRFSEMFDVFPSKNAVTHGPVAVRYGGWKTVGNYVNFSGHCLTY